MRTFTAVILPLLSAALLTACPLIARADTQTERTQTASGCPAAATEDVRVEGEIDAPLPDTIQQVIELTNRERLKAGLPALKPQRCLLESARWMAEDMSEHRYFDHRDSGRREMPSRIAEFKYSGYHALGENIAMGQRTPEEVVDAWMSSPGHRANILSASFSEIGVGYVPASARNAYGYWVQDFGSRFDRCPVVIDTGSGRIRESRVKVSIHGQDWVEQMRLSNDSVNWTEWENFRALRDWSLESGPGRRTVFVEVRRSNRTERLQAVTIVDVPAAKVLVTADAR